MFFKRVNQLQDYINAVLTIIFFHPFFLYTKKYHKLMNISLELNIYVGCL